MDYWNRARKFALRDAKMFAVWKAIPAVLGGLVVLLLHIQIMSQVLTTVSVAVGCYVFLYIAEVAWKLLVKAPTEIYRLQATEIEALNAKIGNLQRKPFDEAHRKLTIEKLDKQSPEAIEVLKYVLHNPDIEARGIPLPNAQAHAPGLQMGGFLTKREDRPGNGLWARSTYYTVNEAFRAVLEDFFYPKSS